MKMGLHRACVIAAVAATGSVAFAQPPNRDCGCISNTVMMRMTALPPFPDGAITHWGDIVPDAQAATIASPFPPAGGYTSQFQSLCGGPWLPGDEVFAAGLATGRFMHIGEQLYFFGNPAAWGVRNDCSALWSPRYPLNLDMRFGAAAGDYGPKHLALAESTSAMVSSIGQPYGWPSALSERATIGGNIDMITGAPLLEETDFVLPFGSATFRWNRTYSETSSRTRHEYDSIIQYQSGRLHNFLPSSQWWDWAGQGWMVGAAPLLLIDATNWGSSETAGEPRCYFLPDAHQSIPFLLQDWTPTTPTPASRTYTAPPRFGMVLSHNLAGQPNPWNPRPTEWYVWTHERSIRYTFSPVYDDVGYEAPYRAGQFGPYEIADLESTPPNGALSVGSRFGEGKSLGMPHYAVLKRIDDLNGNRVDFEYTPFLREPLALPPNTTPLPIAAGCTEMVQRSQMKGQIKRIRLLSGLDHQQSLVDTPANLTNSGITVGWTIIPVYRAFGGSDTQYDPHTYSIQNAQPYGNHLGSGLYVLLDPPHPAARFEVQHALDTVLAYRGNMEVPISSNGRPWHDLTLPNEMFKGLGTGLTHASPLSARKAALKNIVAMDAAAECHLSTKWEYRVRYIYADGSATFNDDIALLEYSRPFRNPGGGEQISWTHCPPLQSPRLLFTTVTHQQDPDLESNKATRSHRMYRYLAHHWGDPVSNLDVPLDFWSLQGVWGTERMEAVKDDIIHSSAWDPETRQELVTDWPLGLMLKRGTSLPHDDVIPVKPLPGELATVTKPLLYSAEQVLEPWDSREAGYSADPASTPCLLTTTDNTPTFGSEMKACLASALDCIGTSATVQPLLDRDGVAIYTARADGQTGEVFRIYRFLVLPNSLPAEWAGDYHTQSTPGVMGALNHNIAMMRTMFHHPYLTFPARSGQQTEVLPLPLTANHKPSLGSAFWAVVIDKHSSWDAAAWSKYLADHPSAGAEWPTIEDMRTSSDPDKRKRMPDGRRLVLLNAAGSILLDRHWQYAGFAGGSSGSEGLWEQRVYDWSLVPPPANAIGRLKEIRTVGWAAAKAAGHEDDQGLIRVFDYDTREELHDSLEVGAVGSKQGLNGQVQWQKQLIRDKDRHDVVKYEIAFTKPDRDRYEYGDTNISVTANPHGDSITFRGYRFDNLTKPDGSINKRVNREVTIRPPAVEADGIPRYPVEINQTDCQYAPITDRWRGYGALASVQSLIDDQAPQVAAGDTFYADMQRTDECGRSVFSWIDAAATNPQVKYYFLPATKLGEHPPVRPTGWTRSGSHPALSAPGHNPAPRWSASSITTTTVCGESRRSSSTPSKTPTPPPRV